MACWNGLSADQQRRLLEWGGLPFGYTPDGDCQRGAEVEITTMYDAAPGPRFYCRPCAVVYLAGPMSACLACGGHTDLAVLCAGCGSRNG